MFEQAMHFFNPAVGESPDTPSQGGQSAAPEKGAAAPAEGDAQIDALQKQIDEMQRQLKSIQKG